jgi:hypothetical protein
VRRWNRGAEAKQVWSRNARAAEATHENTLETEEKAIETEEKARSALVTKNSIRPFA